MVEYLAEAAVNEESADTVREECLTGLLTRTSTLDAALAALRAPVRRLRFNTVKPADSIGRRLRKVLEKLEKAAADVKAEPTGEAGKELAALVSDAFRSNQLPESEDVRQLVAEEAIQVIDRIVKTRFSLATEVSTYAVLEIRTRLVSGFRMGGLHDRVSLRASRNRRSLRGPEDSHPYGTDG